MPRPALITTASAEVMQLWHMRWRSTMLGVVRPVRSVPRRGLDAGHGRTPLLLIGAATLTLVLTTWSAERMPGSGWERTVSQRVVDLPDWTTPVLRFVMQAGTRAAPLLVALGLAAVARWRGRAAVIVVASLGAWLATSLLKDIVDRPRPSLSTLGSEPLAAAEGAGFPSSHTAIATALAVSLVALARPRRLVALALLAVPALTAVARVHIGVHWPLDVVGGVSIGVMFGTFASCVVPRPPSGPVRRAGTDDELVVATFNVRNGRALDGRHSWPFRAGPAATVVREMGADVVAVQEAFAFQVRWLAAALPGYEVLGRGRGRRGGEQCAVFVRIDRLEVLESDTRWFGDDPHLPGSRLPGSSFPRIATIARLRDRRSGARIELANTHLDQRAAANRLRSAEQLLSWVDLEQPTVVVGDLNGTQRRDPDLFDVFDAHGLENTLPATGPGTAHDYRGGTDHPRLDHILVTEHWEIVSSRVVDDIPTRTYPSDHWPVVAHLRLRPSP